MTFTERMNEIRKNVAARRDGQWMAENIQQASEESEYQSLVEQVERWAAEGVLNDRIKMLVEGNSIAKTADEKLRLAGVIQKTLNLLEKKAKLGSGARFKAVEKAAKKSGASDPAAVAAAAGRKKYGKKKFQKLAAAGKRKG